MADIVPASSPADRASDGAAGFSLLEVIVVLALVAAALVPLFQMQSTLSQSSRRAADQAMVARGIDLALAHFDVINPTRSPNGEMRVDDLVIIWSSTRVQTHVRSTSITDAQPSTVGLYEVDFELHDLSGRRLFTDQLFMVGWSQDAEDRP